MLPLLASRTCTQDTPAASHILRSGTPLANTLPHCGFDCQSERLFSIGSPLGPVREFTSGQRRGGLLLRAGFG